MSTLNRGFSKPDLSPANGRPAAAMICRKSSSSVRGSRRSNTRPISSNRTVRLACWSLLHSLFEVVLLDTRQLGAPDLFSRQRPLKVPSDSTKKSTKPAYSILSKFDQGEASSNVTETICHQESLISTANFDHQISSIINGV